MVNIIFLASNSILTCIIANQLTTDQCYVV